MGSGRDIPVGRAKICRVLAFMAGALAAGSATVVLAGAVPAASPTAAATASAQPTVPLPTVSPSPADPSDHWSFFSQYCEKCHNTEDWAGGVAFDTMTPQDIPDQAEIWEHAVRKLRGRLMPPPGNPQPDATTIHSFVGWMENTLDTGAATRPDPGRVALHRLNRKEYANAVWDLLHVSVDPNTILPQDDRSDGFDNVASVLQVSPSFLDQYLSAARAVAVQAVGEMPEHPIGIQYVVKNPTTQAFHVDGLPLGTRGGPQNVVALAIDTAKHCSLSPRSRGGRHHSTFHRYIYFEGIRVHTSNERRKGVVDKFGSVL